jgi:hypothetical protein
MLQAAENRTGFGYAAVCAARGCMLHLHNNPAVAKVKQREN